MTQLEVRAATESDLPAIAAIALATGQDEDWDQAFPAYQRHLKSACRPRIRPPARCSRPAGESTSSTCTWRPSPT